MENTIENKRAFSAQYWGQNILYIFFGSNEAYAVKIDENTISQIKENECWLFLKPLSQITDEDALIIADILDLSFRPKVDQIKRVKNWVTDQGVDHYTPFMWNELQAFDKLKELGYAVPYRGLSVDELVKREWVKLKED